MWGLFGMSAPMWNPSLGSQEQWWGAGGEQELRLRSCALDTGGTPGFAKMACGPNDLVSGHPLAFSCFLETGYGSGCLSWGQTPVVPSACQQAWPQPKHSPHPKLPACSHQTPVGLGLVSLVLPAQGSPTLGAALFSHQHSGRGVCLESQAQRILLWAWSHAPHVSSICWPIGCNGVGSLFLF